jgi:hypothetical protein
MGLFTPTQFLKPSQWLQAIPIVREKVLALIHKSDFSMKSAQDLVDWSKLLLSIMKREEQLRNLVNSSKELQEEETWYPIRVSNHIFNDLRLFILIHEGKMTPLSEAGSAHADIIFQRE